MREEMREHREEPFFLFVHTYTVHDYDPPDEYRRCKQEGCTSTLGDFTPLRLTRERETGIALGFPGLYPIGEGAGYAGGIMSAAIDGARAAKRFLSE